MYNYCVFLKLSTNVLAQFRNPVSTLNPIYLDFRLWEDFEDHICHIVNNICVSKFLNWDLLFFLRREIWRLFFISRSDSVSFPLSKTPPISSRSSPGNRYQRMCFSLTHLRGNVAWDPHRGDFYLNSIFFICFKAVIVNCKKYWMIETIQCSIKHLPYL